jgi:D-alanine transaminase
MEIAYFNGKYLPKDDVKISPDDRGFLFAEGIYEVVRWYESFFYDMVGHLARMKRSLREVQIRWPEEDSFPVIARELVRLNNIEKSSDLPSGNQGRSKTDTLFSFSSCQPDSLCNC